MNTRALRAFEHRRLHDRGNVTLAVLFVVVAALGLYSSLRDAGSAWERFTAAAARHAQPWGDQNDPDYEFGPPLPPRPLRALSAGHGRDVAEQPLLYGGMELSRLLGSVPYDVAVPDVFVETIGRFDLAFALTVFLPLLVIGTSYDMLSRERDEGTLPLVLSQPISLRRLLFVKIATRAPWLAAAGVVPYLIAGGQRWSLLTLNDGLLLVAGAALVAAYSLLWLSACALVNALGRSTVSNAVLLCTLWLASTLVIPPAMDLYLRTAFNAPDESVIDQEVRAFWLSPAASTRQPLVDGYLRRFLDNRPEFLPLPTSSQPAFASNLQYLASQHHLNERIVPTLSALDRRYQQRDRMLLWLRHLSPAAIVSDTLDRIAGTDERRYRAFQLQLRDHVLAKTRHRIAHAFRDRPLPGHLFPTFVFVDVPFGDTLMASLTGLLQLASLTAALAWLGVRHATATRML